MAVKINKSKILDLCDTIVLRRKILEPKYHRIQDTEYKIQHHGKMLHMTLNNSSDWTIQGRLWLCDSQRNMNGNTFIQTKLGLNLPSIPLTLTLWLIGRGLLSGWLLSRWLLSGGFFFSIQYHVILNDLCAKTCSQLN